jgi:hypothetical protein
MVGNYQVMVFLSLESEVVLSVPLTSLMSLFGLERGIEGIGDFSSLRREGFEDSTVSALQPRQEQYSYCRARMANGLRAGDDTRMKHGDE